MVSMPTEPDEIATSGGVSRRVPDEARGPRLRERLIVADGFYDTLSALRADRAVAVVAEWLRDEAATTRNRAYGADYPNGPVQRRHELHAANVLRRLADALGVCCDMHNQHCEPPSELCCWQCAEARHPDHTDGTTCVLPDPNRAIVCRAKDVEVGGESS